MGKSIGILNSCLTFLIIAVLTTSVPSPVPLSAANLGWSTIKTPNNSNLQLIQNNDIDLFAIAPDGNDMFAYDNNTHLLYRSYNSGWSWTTDTTGYGLEGDVDGSGVINADDNVADIAISPNFASDTTVVAAIKGKVFYSNDGGKNFHELGTNLGGLLVGGAVITSVAIAPSYQGNIAIIAGASNGTQGGGVYIFTMSTLSWNDLTVGDWASPPDPCDVLDLAFSPNSNIDAGILAVVTYSVGGTVNTKLTSKFGNTPWGATVSNATIFAEEATTAVMAFPADFEWSSSFHVLVGTSGTTTTHDDAFLVNGASVGSTSTVSDLNVNGTSLQTEVHSIAIKGYLDNGEVLVSQKGSTVIKYTSSSIYAATVSWSESTKSPTPPTGSTNTIVAWSPVSSDAYAATSGTGSALSRSTDGGVVWNQIGLIDIGSLANLAITDVAVVDENTIFLLMYDDASAPAGYSAGDYTMLFKTTNGGRDWEQVWSHRSTSTTDAMTILKLSPGYTSDKTLFVAQNDSMIWKTTDGGITFSGTIAPASITALGVVDQSTYYTGHTNAINKSGRWIAPATLEGDVAKSIVITPDKSAIFVGTNNGNVFMSTDDARTFQLLGTSQSLGTSANILVALDSNYALSKTIFAGSSDASKGVSRWVVGQSTQWKEIDDDTSSLSCSGLAVSSEGVLYAANNTADKGVRRSITPNAELSYINPESVVIDLPAGAKLSKLAVLPNSNIIYSIAGNLAVGDYGYKYRLLSFTDTLVVTPELVAPADKTTAPGPITLAWKAIESVTSPTYRYQVATDSTFDNKVIDATTTGTSVTITGLLRGVQYWWRIFVEKGNPLMSRTSATRTFSLEPPAPVLKSPNYGATDVILKPTFSWLPVPDATSYELELADNVNFSNAWVQKELTNTVWAWNQELEYSTAYYWRVRAIIAINTQSNPSPWAESVFTTKAKPVAPQPSAIVETEKLPPPPVIEVPSPPLEVPLSPVPASSLSAVQLRVIIIIFSLLFVVIIALIISTRRIRRL